MDPISIVKEAKELAEIKYIIIAFFFPEARNGSITNDLYHIGHTLIVGVVSCLSVIIRGSFAQSWSVWEHKACPLSGIKKVRLWDRRLFLCT